MVDWYQQQHYSVRAAVIGAIALILGVFVTGCFTIIAALISRPTPPDQVILPTFFPTSQTIISTVPPPLASPAATSSGQSSSPSTKPISDPLFQSIESFINSLPYPTIPLILGTVGLAIMVVALLSIIQLNQGNRYFALALAVILELYFFARWLGWWGLLATFVAGMFTVLLSDEDQVETRRIPGLLLGAAIGGVLGIGASLFYLAFVGHLESVYLLVGLIVLGTIGGVIGLIWGA